MTLIDTVIDYCFYIDLVMNFITGYENDDRNSEFRLRNIAVRYVRSWFLIDLLACLPFDKVFEAAFSNNNIEKANQDAGKLLRLLKMG